MRIVLAVALSLGLVANAAEELPKELTEIQGVWKLVGFAGGEQDGPPPVAYLWHIQGDKVQYGGEPFAVLKLDAKATPRALDLTVAKTKAALEGIYAVEGDKLRICVNKQADGVKERPEKFDVKDRPDFRLFTFERVKGDKVDPLEGLSGFVGVQIKAEEDTKRVVVVDTIKDSPAAKAGLKGGDVVLAVNGGEAKDLPGVVDTIRRVKPGNAIALKLERDGKEVAVTVKAGVLPFFLLD